MRLIHFFFVSENRGLRTRAPIEDLRKGLEQPKKKQQCSREEEEERKGKRRLSFAFASLVRLGESHLNRSTTNIPTTSRRRPTGPGSEKERRERNASSFEKKQKRSAPLSLPFAFHLLE